jgi:hypothetical protein
MIFGVGYFVYSGGCWIVEAGKHLYATASACVARIWVEVLSEVSNEWKRFVEWVRRLAVH